MGPLQPGEEVEMAELPAGTCGTIVICDDVPGSHQWAASGTVRDSSVHTSVLGHL